MTVVYIDLVFLLNLIANYLLLLAAGRMAGSPLRRLWIGLSAAIGAIYACLLFLPGLEWLGAWPCRLVSGVLMVVIAYGTGRQFLRATVMFFGASTALAGLVLAVQSLGGSQLTMKNGVLYSALDLRLLLLLLVLCYFVLSLFFRRMACHSGRELVRLEMVLLGQRIGLVALRDSGHTLTDPSSNKTVVVADARCMLSVVPEGVLCSDPIGALKKCHELGVRGVQLLPYRAVGVECGMLLAFRSESVKVEGKELGQLLVAISPTLVDDGGGYQALIGGIEQ